jgi:predicted RNase H-like HicB family nuclease
LGDSRAKEAIEAYLEAMYGDGLSIGATKLRIS